jgi:GTP cyclohydrolase II
VSSPARRVALAVDALRHGWAIEIAGRVLVPAETGFGADRLTRC